MKKIFWVPALFAALSAFAEEKISSEKILVNQRGFITCGGSTSAPLFTKDCKKLTLSRVTTQGAIKYEGTCLDSNEMTSVIACDAFVFEYSRVIAEKKEGFGE